MSQDELVKPVFFFAIDVINKDLGWGDTVFIRASSAEDAVKHAVKYLEAKSLRYHTNMEKWEMTDIRQVSAGTYRRKKHRSFGSRKQRFNKEEVKEVQQSGLLNHDIRDLKFIAGMLKKKYKSYANK